MTPEERYRLIDERTTERMREVVAASRMTAELLAALGLKGAPGFMGRGTYASSEGRRAGYLQGRN